MYGENLGKYFRAKNLCPMVKRGGSMVVWGCMAASRVDIILLKAA